MPSVPVRQCLLVSGSPWTSPDLFWVIRELSRFGISRVLIAAGGARPDVAAVRAGLPRPVDIRIIDGGSDLPSAIRLSEERLDERFLVYTGNRPFDANLAPLLSAPGAMARFADRETGLMLLRRDAPAPSSHITLRGRFLEGVHRHRPALFLDRDGVINIDHGYVGTRERFEWVSGARETIAAATGAGWHVFVVTNQSGIARGHYSQADFHALCDWMSAEALASGGTIDDIRHAPFHRDAIVPAFRVESSWRKPSPGMILDLMRVWEPDPRRCVMIGDQASDLQAAAAAGISGHRFMGGNLHDFAMPILTRLAA